MISERDTPWWVAAKIVRRQADFLTEQACELRRAYRQRIVWSMAMEKAADALSICAEMLRIEADRIEQTQLTKEAP